MSRKDRNKTVEQPKNDNVRKVSDIHAKKVQAGMSEIAALKLRLGELNIAYRQQELDLLTRLQQVDQRTVQVVREAAAGLDIDPDAGGWNFDYVSLEFRRIQPVAETTH